jgi:hypothetical protein
MGAEVPAAALVVNAAAAAAAPGLLAGSAFAEFQHPVEGRRAIAVAVPAGAMAESSSAAESLGTLLGQCAAEAGRRGATAVWWPLCCSGGTDPRAAARLYAAALQWLGAREVAAAVLVWVSDADQFLAAVGAGRPATMDAASSPERQRLAALGSDRRVRRQRLRAEIDPGSAPSPPHTRQRVPNGETQA